MQLFQLSNWLWTYQESDSKDEQNFKAEASSTLQQLAKALEQWETQQLLGGQYDKLGAILSIQVRLHESGFPSDCPDHCIQRSDQLILLLENVASPPQSGSGC